MKKYIIGLLLVGILAMSASAIESKQRYLIKSDNSLLKSMFAINQEFMNGFTADLMKKQVNDLKKLGVEVEEVPQYHVLEGFSRFNQPSIQLIPPCTPPVEQTPYGVEMVNGGSGGIAKVAVLDTGTNIYHPDLKGSIVDCKDFTRGRIRTSCTDNNGHGTHVAGTIAAHGKIIGVAPTTKIMAYAVCNYKGICYADDIASGIRYAANRGANIISMSFGGRVENSLIRDAINYAYSKGVLMVAASGNMGNYESTGPTISYPAANPKVIAVGAIDSDQELAYFSSTGIDDEDDSTIAEKEIEFVAPGVNVESTYKDRCYKTLSGTSMATPHISGLASKLWQGNALDTRLYLRERALDLGDIGYDSKTGYGLPIA